MFEQQPMKMASAESLCHTETGAAFSILTMGTHNNCDSVIHVHRVPKLTSFLATTDFDSTLQGVSEIQPQDVREVRSRQLPPEPVRLLLGLPRHDGLVRGLGAAGAGRVVVDPTGPGAHVEVVQPACA